MNAIIIGVIILVILFMIDTELTGVGVFVGGMACLIISYCNSPSDKVEYEQIQVQLEKVDGHSYIVTQGNKYVMRVNDKYWIISQDNFEIALSDSTFYEIEYKYTFKNYDVEQCDPNWCIFKYEADTIKSFNKFIFHTEKNTYLFN